MLHEARKLDSYQKAVLRTGVGFARGVVKARHLKNKPTVPPIFMVHGGAGSGKSTVIKTLHDHMQHLLRETGDNPNCPSVVLTAFTGAAAANIGGKSCTVCLGSSLGQNSCQCLTNREMRKESSFKILEP